ncbi:hypothetical protein [Rathayibacter sp. Leaf248]|uniref:hypothetical protein n=1 Tax=Rathayibacter sp. Leaf248 TaxID=2876555 RepID=UPI001E3DEF4F|nr:hypothetical protein [Rathayibacter sp. Leaf248]
MAVSTTTLADLKGPSAYDIAVRLGLFTGSEAEFIASLKGEDGEPGDDGATPTIQIGTVTTLAAGTQATASATSVDNVYTISFGIPKGADGTGGTGTGLTDGSVQTSHLQAKAVTGAKIADNTITSAQISEVDSSKVTGLAALAGGKADKVNGLVPPSQLGTGATAGSTTKVLFEDGVWRNVGGATGNVPSGGTSKQFLMKGSAATADYDWAGLASAYGFVTPQQFGATGSLADLSKDASAAIQAAQDYASERGLPVVLNGHFNCASGVSARGQDIRWYGKFTLYDSVGATPVLSAVELPDRYALSSVTSAFVQGLERNPSGKQLLTVLVPTAQTTLAKIKVGAYGRVYSSSQRYTWKTVSSDSQGPLKASGTQFLGVYYPVTKGGLGPREGDMIYGVTSGAIGHVAAYAPDTLTAGKMVLKSLTGAFTKGEEIRVGSKSSTAPTAGTIADVGAILLKDLFEDTFTTANLYLDIYKERVTDIEGMTLDTLPTSTDPDAMIDQAQRRPSVILGGRPNARLRYTVRGSYQAGVIGVAMANADVESNTILQPNDATQGDNGYDQQGAYGYNYEYGAASYKGKFRIGGTNARHLFTTNSYIYGSMGNYAVADAYSYLASAGKGRFPKIHGDASGTWAHPYDTHPGVHGAHFSDITVDFSGAAGRKDSPSKGISSRGTGTIIERFTIIGAAVGVQISEKGYTYDGLHSRSIVRQGTMIGIQKVGVDLGETYPSDSTRFSSVVEDLRIEFATLEQNTIDEAAETFRPNGFDQVGVSTAGHNADLRRLTLKGMNFAAIGINSLPRGSGSSAEYLIDDVVFDYRGSGAPSSGLLARGIWVQGASSGTNASFGQNYLHIGKVTVYEQDNSPAGLIHLKSGSPSIRRGPKPIVHGSTAELPYHGNGGTLTMLRLIGSPPWHSVGSTEPKPPLTGDRWDDTSNGFSSKKYNGSSWVAA